MPTQAPRPSPSPRARPPESSPSGPSARRATSFPALTKEFEAANPGATVKVTAIPWDSAHDKFASAITAGQTPDAAMVGSTWMGEFAGMDALDPTPASIDTKAFFEGAQKTTEVAGTAYGIPW